MKTAAYRYERAAVGIVRELIASGFWLRVADTDRLQVEPGSRLTLEQRQLLAQHKTEVLALLRDCDDGVFRRHLLFHRQFRAAAAGQLPCFVFEPDVPYAPGVCFSCGDPNNRPNFGRCRRCSLAWRLACDLPIPADLAAAIDGAKKVA